MEEDVYPIGSRVRVVHESPYRGRKGTILAFHMNATPGKPTCGFYLVALDGARVRKPIWFAYREIELVTLSCDQAPES